MGKSKTELKYRWIVGPDDNPDPEWWSAIAEPREIETRVAKRFNPGNRARRPVIAVEPDPNRIALTVPEAAWLLYCSVNTVFNLIRRDELKSRLIGRKRLIARAEVERLVSGD
jgi:excisionase family DNA binding protein